MSTTKDPMSYVSNQKVPKYTLRHQKSKYRQFKTWKSKTKDPKSYVSNKKLPKYTLKHQHS